MLSIRVNEYQHEVIHIVQNTFLWIIYVTITVKRNIHFFFLITYFKHNNYDTTNENNQD